MITGLQSGDPGFTPIADKDYDVKFPSQFASGNAPDDDLPEGTCVEVTVQATNSVGSDQETSNCYMPQAPNPDGAAGVITDVEDSAKLTVVGTMDGNPYNMFDGETSTKAGAWDFLNTNISVTMSVPETGTLYVVGSSETAAVNDDNLLTITDGGSSKTQTFTQAVTEYDLGPVVGWTSFNLYSGSSGNGGCYVKKFMIDRQDGKGKVDLIISENGQNLTVSSPTNLDTFVADDSLVMVDDTGAVASYVPVTSEITNVGMQTGTNCLV